MDILRVIIVSVALLVPPVTGIQFQLSQNNIDLGNPQSDLVTLTCSMTVTPAFTPVRVVSFIKILMEPTSGSGWEQVATIAGQENASLSPFLPNNIRSIMQVSGTLVADPATNSQLVFSMNASLITCLHARQYQCQLSYLYGEDFDPRNEDQNITLSATASPTTPHIETVKNLNTNQVINVANEDTSTLTIQQNEELEIVCKANIGSNQNTIIQWEYSSSSGTGMIGFNGYKENGEVQADNSGGTATNCRYTRTSTIRHNISDIDAARGSSNPLIFSCYIQAEGVLTQNNPMYTVSITNLNLGTVGTDPNQGTVGTDPNQGTVGTDPNQGTEGADPNQGTVGSSPNQEAVNTIAIVLPVLAVVLVIIVVNVVVWLCLWNRRKRATRTSVLKESIHMEQRDIKVISKQSDEDDSNNYSNTYAYIPDVYLDCASAGEVRNGEEARDKDGEIHKPVQDYDDLIANENEHSYLSFKRREPEADDHGSQDDTLETDSYHLYTNMVVTSDINSADGYITPISSPTKN